MASPDVFNAESHHKSWWLHYAFASATLLFILLYIYIIYMCVYIHITYNNRVIYRHMYRAFFENFTKWVVAVVVSRTDHYFSYYHPCYRRCGDVDAKLKQPWPNAVVSEWRFRYVLLFFSRPLNQQHLTVPRELVRRGSRMIMSKMVFFF